AVQDFENLAGVPASDGTVVARAAVTSVNGQSGAVVIDTALPSPSGADPNDVLTYDGTSATWAPPASSVPGKSAYEVAVDDGFVGTEEEWLASLKGLPGTPGKTNYQLAVEGGYTG